MLKKRMAANTCAPLKISLESTYGANHIFIFIYYIFNDVPNFDQDVIELKLKVVTQSNTSFKTIVNRWNSQYC